MKNLLAVTGFVLTAAGLYLLLWPVPIDPVAWNAPVDRGLADPFEVNDRLRYVQAIDLGNHGGPEDVTGGFDGSLYATSEQGDVLRIGSPFDVSVFAHAGGRPLGIEMAADGALLVANATIGLQRIELDGTVTTLLDEVHGQPLVYADDLAIASDATVYFSEASTKFGAAQFGGTYPASLLDIMEHGAHGRVIEFKPESGEANVIVDDLNFANGIAISEDQTFLLIAETGSYRILKHWLQGPDADSTIVLIDNLPAFPDNINNGRNGRFWIGLIAPRIKALDALSDFPFARKIVQRLPATLRPKALPYSHVIAIDAEGEVLMNLQDSEARLPSLTGVFETRDALYLTTLFGNRLGKLDKDDL